MKEGRKEGGKEGTIIKCLYFCSTYHQLLQAIFPVQANLNEKFSKEDVFKKRERGKIKSRERR